MDVERRLEQKPRQVLADEGYNNRANIRAMQAAEIRVRDAGAGVAESAVGVVVGDVGVQREVVDPVGLAAGGHD